MTDPTTHTNAAAERLAADLGLAIHPANLNRIEDALLQARREAFAEAALELQTLRLAVERVERKLAALAGKGAEDANG